MSSYRSKLERVRFAPSLREGASFAAHRTPITTTPLPRDPRNRLEVLRERIAELLVKTSPPRREHVADPTQGDLPFVREETRLGPLYIRTKRLSAAHRVGRAQVLAGARASAGMLALLALDPALASLDVAGALYIDTETTGLSSGSGTVPFLIG